MKNNNYVLVFDIGSSKIRAMIAGRAVNNTLNIRAYREVNYDGFYEGKFLSQEKLSGVLGKILQDFSEISQGLSKVYISVPSEFSSVRTNQIVLNFGDKRKIRKQDIDSLIYTASEKAKNGDVEVVSVNPIIYTLDDGRNTLDPIGESAKTLTATLSVIYADSSYIGLFNSILSNFPFQSVQYISDPLSQVLCVIPKEKREDLAILIDCGDLSTSVAFAKGDGLVGLTSFSRGGGFITNDLSEAFDLSMSDADKLKKMIVLSLKGKQNNFYELQVDGGKVEKINLNTANEVASYRIEELAQVISKCSQLYTKELVSFVPIYLTGAGICCIKGGRDYLSKCLGKNINYGAINLPGKEDKPDIVSVYALVNSALQSENL